MLFLLVFFPFSLKSFLALIRGSTTLTGRWSWKFLVISWHKMQRFTCDETGLETHAPLESSAPPYNSNSYSLLPSCAVSVAPAFSPPVQEKTWNTIAIQAIPADSQILLANHVLMKDLQNTQPCPRPSRPCRPCFPNKESCCKDTRNQRTHKSPRIMYVP